VRAVTTSPFNDRAYDRDYHTNGTRQRIPRAFERAISHCWIYNKYSGYRTPRFKVFVRRRFLISASNTETGTFTYTDNADGNVLSRTSLAPNQPANSTATVTLSYSYDQLRRPSES
jgi:hypothetical protein